MSGDVSTHLPGPTRRSRQDAAGQAAVGTITTVADVLERMSRIQRELTAYDGVFFFNAVYMATTRAVLAGIQRGHFEDPAFVERLDVVFALRYFEAFDASSGTGPVSAAWQPLFRARARPGVEPIRFALAGMNAHINYDLPIALVRTCREAGIRPVKGGVAHRDFLRVNEILEATQSSIKDVVVDGFLEILDETCGSADDALSHWGICRARDFAWESAERLWELHPVDRRRARYLNWLSRLVSVLGRGVL